MFRRLYRIAALIAVVLTAGISSAENDVLYWMIDDSATVTPMGCDSSVSISDFFSGLGYGDDSAFAARIRVTGGDIADDANVFLDLYIPGYGVDVGGGEYGVEFSNVGGYWGAGVPTGNQSPSEAYAAGSPEYSFTVELGNIDSSDNWTTVAWGETKSYTQLTEYIHQTFDMNPSSMMVWTPTQFTYVPEPSSGLLAAVGFAFLALRRRKCRYRDKP